MKKIKKHLKNGSGEALAFICLMPALLLTVYALISMIQLTLLRQKMEYAAYAACRAAVVSKTEQDANENAKKVAELELGAYGKIFDASTVKVYLKKTVKAVEPAQPGGVDSRSDEQTAKNQQSGWVKGTFLECTLVAKLKRNNVFIHGQTKKCKVTMAVEKEDY